MNKASAILSILLLSVLPVMIFSGCTDNRFSHFVELPQRGWAYVDSVSIPADNPDSLPRRLSVAVRHDDSFIYRNLWIEISYRDHNGNLCRDSANIELADIYGRWLGQGIGSSYQRAVTVDSAVNIPDSTTVYIRHIMRVDTLKGIRQIGIALADIE